jgi:spermidine/putrescine transport system ATP-binding protein
LERADRQSAAISLRGLSKTYGGDNVALKPLDLDIEPGEFFCLLGPSGCGKTTTLNLVGGFLRPTVGEIWIGDTRVDRLPPHKRPVNTVFQSYALFPHLTIHENVGFGLKMAKVGRREAEQRIADALALVGLEGYGERGPDQLSGGQQQRVAVARALVNRPDVLLLDEPLGALDLKLRKRLQVELAQIHRDVGTTFVYVTHDQEEAMSMGDRIAVMNDGLIEQVGTPAEMYNRPSSRFVADFIGESNLFEVEAHGSGEIVATTRTGAKVPCRADAGAAGAAVVMVRPECVLLQPVDEHTNGALRGRIAHASFLGSHIRVAVESDAVTGHVLVDIAGHGRAPVSLEPDTPVALTWEPDNAIVLQ